MSRSPHRLRADPAEVWTRLLFGELVRAVDRDVTVRDEPTIRLPRSGRWETGLARVRPALGDALGSTALAVAWRWACVDQGALAWPGLNLVARKATGRRVVTAAVDALARFEGGGAVLEGRAAGACSWTLRLADGKEIAVSLTGPAAGSLSEVDRLADVAAAWLDATWAREG